MHRNQGWATYAFDWGFYLLLLPVTVPYRIASTTFTGCYNIVAYFFGLPALPGGLAGRRPPIGRDWSLYNILQHIYSFAYGSTLNGFMPHPGTISSLYALYQYLNFIHNIEEKDASPNGSDAQIRRDAMYLADRQTADTNFRARIPFFRETKRSKLVK